MRSLSAENDSFVRRLDARVKLVLLLAFVISLSILRFPSPLQLGFCLLLVVCAAAAARLPIGRLLGLSLLVVPFVGLFAVIVYLTGDARRAWAILSKSYLSALAVLVAISCTPLGRLLEAARFFHVPVFLIEVTALTYRYLFVLRSQAEVMLKAFHARAGRPGQRAMKASSGMVAVLFTRSYERAAMIHQAMLGRGFSGILMPREFPPLTAQDVAVAAGGLALTAVVHFL